MKAESDSESAEEIDIKTEIAELRTKLKIQEGQLKNKHLDFKVEIEELKNTVNSLQGQYDFSTRANASLRDDYDLLQEKLDKTMKTANNQVQDRNEQIDKLTQRMTVLENFYDENQEIMENAKK